MILPLIISPLYTSAWYSWSLISLHNLHSSTLKSRKCLGSCDFWFAFKMRMNLVSGSYIDQSKLVDKRSVGVLKYKRKSTTSILVKSLNQVSQMGCMLDH